MRKRNFCVAMAAALLAGVMLSGCGGNSGGTATSAQSGGTEAKSEAKTEAAAGDGQNIVYITNKDFVSTLEPIVAKYKEETGVNVTLEGYSFSDLTDVIEVKIGSGNKDYDVIAVDAPLATSYAKRGLVAPIEAYYSDDEKKELTDVSVSAGSYEDQFYCPPMNTSSQVLFYNKKLLEDAGVSLPEGITVDNRITWEALTDLVRQAIGVLDPEHNNGIYGMELRQVSRVYQMNMLPNSLGGKNIGDDGYTVDGVINSEEWVKAMTWYQNLVNEGLFTRGISADETRNLFISDKIIFMVDTTSLTSVCDKNGMDHYGWIPVPCFEGYEDKTATPTGSWHFGINAHSERKDEAADFIKWMSIGEGADLWYENYHQLPTKVELLEQIEQDAEAPEYLKISAYESANTAVLRAMTPGFNEYSTILNAAWEDVRNGSDVKTTLDDAVSQINTAFEVYK